MDGARAPRPVTIWVHGNARVGGATDVGLTGERITARTRSPVVRVAPGRRSDPCQNEGRNLNDRPGGRP